MLRNTSSSQYATLAANTQGEVVKGEMKTGSNKQKWFVEELDNGNFTLTNTGYDTTTYAFVKAASGQSVTHSTSATQWKITELDPGTYRIAVSSFAWSLEDGEVKLAPFDKDDPRQTWKFQTAT